MAALHRRPGAWLVALSAAWAALVLVMVSDGALSIYSDMLAIYVGAGLVATALLVTLVLGTRQPPGAPKRRRWPPLAFAMFLIAVMPSLCRYNIPFSVRLAKSEGALAAAAAAPKPQVPTTIGWMRVHEIDADVDAGVTRFTTGACGFAERCGVAYSPAGRPPHDPAIAYKAVRGAFWSFERRSGPPVDR